MAVTREQLYNEVWAEPMTTVARRYGVSSSYLARVCTQLNVPRPPRGYWAQLEFGKADARPPLPPARVGDQLEWVRANEPRDRSLPRPQAPSPSVPTVSKPRAKHPAMHPLLLAIQEHFEVARRTTSGYLKPRKRNIVDVFVSGDALARALGYANDLFLALEDRGHRVMLAGRDHPSERRDPDLREKPGPRTSDWGDRWRPGRPTIVFIGTVALGLSLYEMSENAEVRSASGAYERVAAKAQSRHAATYDWTFRRDMPSGRLALRAYSPYVGAAWERVWSAAKTDQLPAPVEAVISALEHGATTVAQLAQGAEVLLEHQRQEWEAKQRAWARQEAEKRHREAIANSRRELLRIIRGWAQARRVEQFFGALEQHILGLSPKEQAIVRERIQVAKELMGTTDTLRRLALWKTPKER